MKAHCAAADKFGRHRALHEAANMLAEVLRSNVELTGAGTASALNAKLGAAGPGED